MNEIGLIHYVNIVNLQARFFCSPHQSMSVFRYKLNLVINFFNVAMKTILLKTELYQNIEEAELYIRATMIESRENVLNITLSLPTCGDHSGVSLVSLLTTNMKKQLES